MRRMLLAVEHLGTERGRARVGATSVLAEACERHDGSRPGEITMSEFRITLVPGVCDGRTTIRVLRVAVVDVLELLAGGMITEEILADYPYLKREEIAACLDFAARQARREELPIKRDAV